MQRVLADVTRHMEQQYLAQKSLEKLRADNEALAIRQKDRKVGGWVGLWRGSSCNDSTLSHCVAEHRSCVVLCLCLDIRMYIRLSELVVT